MAVTGEMGVEAGGDPSARFAYRATLSDYLRLNAALVRRSSVSMVVGTFFLASSAIVIAQGDPIGILSGALGLAFASGFVTLPFVWFATRRRGDLMLVDIEIEADPDGLSITTPNASNRLRWSTYRTARETGEAFLLQPGIGASSFVLKRGAAPDQIEAFRGILRGVGLAPKRYSRLSRPAAIAVGLVVVGGLAFGPGLLAKLQETASMSLATAVSGHSVTVSGITDLPDGAVVDVLVVQRDEYDRAVAQGGDPSVDSPWVRWTDVTIHGGRFAVSFDLTGWPAGRAYALADFWMDSTQPSDAIARFGADGSGLHGPDVVQTSDRGPSLQVTSYFAVP